MGNFDHTYPFAAIVGQEQLKTALLLTAVNPRIGGVVLSGEKGTAKSTLARGLGQLLDAPFVDLPLNITEDRLVGTVDIETTLRTGVPTLSPGLLAQANHGVLYADEVNLLPRQITNILLETSASGQNLVERDGLSAAQPCQFLLIGTMNGEEGPLRAALLDRFGLYAEAHGERNLECRTQIMTRRLQYEANPITFCQHWQGATDALKAHIRRAQALLPEVTFPPECARFAAQLATEGCCQGHRAELVLTETALALAAWDGRREATEQDVRAAAPLALPHRIHQPVNLDSEPQFPTPTDQSDTPAAPPDSLPTDSTSPTESPTDGDSPDTETVQAIQPLDQTLRLHLLPQRRLTATGSGKRLQVRTDALRGRSVRDRLPSGKPTDIAVAATLRAAVLSGRSFGTGRITVTPQDFRQRIREERTGAQILFLVDASGSMGARRRMGAVKGAVLSLLNDAYQKRDSVAIIAFRGSDARVLLPFTRSVDLAQKRLQALPTGGKTPLAAGLTAAQNLLRSARLRTERPAQLLVLVSDGRANQGDTKEPFEEALAAARKLSAQPIASVVLDTEQGFARFGMAEQIAQALGAQHCPLTQISGREILAQINQYIR